MPTILVVDDEPAVLNMIVFMLRQEGFDVLAANCGAQGLSLSRSHHSKIDLLVSDVQMLEMNGPTLAKQLLADNPSLSVLLISGCCTSEEFQEGHPFQCLPKPFNVTSFLSIVRSLAVPDSSRQFRSEGAAMSS